MDVLLIAWKNPIKNVAIMRYSTYFKQLGARVHLSLAHNINELNKLVKTTNFDKIIISVTFPWHRPEVEKFIEGRTNVEVGGSGWDLVKTLPSEVEACQPDYSLYTADDLYPLCKGIGSSESKMKKANMIAEAGIGFTTRGCIRNCEFCIVPIKEGPFRQVAEVSDIINPASNTLILLDNNLTADPDMARKLGEIRQRKLTLEISQGIDIRLITDEQAHALSTVKHRGDIHFAWDLMQSEKAVMDGIKVLSQYVKPSKQACFMLVGFNTTFVEDMYRFEKLKSMGIRPFVMVYDKVGAPHLNDFQRLRLKHFARWCNSHFHRVCSFHEYEPWVKLGLPGWGRISYEGEESEPNESGEGSAQPTGVSRSAWS